MTVTPTFISHFTFVEPIQVRQQTVRSRWPGVLAACRLDNFRSSLSKYSWPNGTVNTGVHWTRIRTSTNTWRDYLAELIHYALHYTLSVGNTVNSRLSKMIHMIVMPLQNQVLGKSGGYVTRRKCCVKYEYLRIACFKPLFPRNKSIDFAWQRWENTGGQAMGKMQLPHWNINTKAARAALLK